MGGLAISAMGLATPLGGAVQAGAAGRAGLSRAAPAPDVLVMHPGDDAPQPVHVHALPAATFGFSGVGRLVALLSEALVDLAAGAPLDWLEGQVRLFLAVPDPAERGFEVAGAVGEQRPEARAAALQRLLVERVEAATGVPLRRMAPSVHMSGEVALADAVLAAQNAVARRQATRALVCAVDSLASADALELFAGQGRLKSRENPVGFVPGEAAGALLLEPVPRTMPAVVLGSPAIRQSPWRFGSDSPPDGRALAACVAEAFEASGGGGDVGLVADLDGESHRASELGTARVHLAARHPALAHAEVRLPAVSFGRTGTASALLGMALGGHSISRGAPGPTRFLVLSSAEDGRRAAVPAWRAAP